MTVSSGGAQGPSARLRRRHTTRPSERRGREERSRLISTRLKSNKYNPDSRQALALVHHSPLTLGGLDMTHTCLIHVTRASEGHITELGALTDANRMRDLINESRDQHKSAAKI